MVENKLEFNFKRFNRWIMLIGFFLIFVISIGYSALNQMLFIEGELIVGVDKIIKVAVVNANHPDNCAHDLYLPKFDAESITINGNIPNLSCKLEYTVTIANHSDKVMELADIQTAVYNNEDIIYELNGIELGQVFIPGSTTIFTLALKYNPELNTLPDNQNIGAIFNFIWQLADSQPPLIAINDKNNLSIFSGTDISLKSLVTITDNIDLDIGEKLLVSSEPEFNNTYGGIYTVKYNATDEAGNQAIEKQIIIYVIEFIKIAAGRFHTLALTRDGYVYSWGHNDLYQLGDGTNTNRTNPIKIGNLSNITDISAGYGSSYAVTGQGVVYSWGYGVYGQLGQGNTSNVNAPKIISSLSNEKIIKIDAGYHSVLALTDNGNVYSWGYNAYSQLGDGNNVAAKNSPFKIQSLTGITDISIGYWHAVATNGIDIYVWGSNQEGQLGISGLSTTGVPTKLSMGAEIKSISAGGRHTMLVTGAGNLYVFGYNTSGQLGLGSTTTMREPQLVTSINNIKEADAGYDHSVAVTNNGEVYTWGNNTYAKLGLGNSSVQRTPAINTALEDVRSVSAQYETIFYLNKFGGIIYGSGYNYYGALGNGTTSNSDTTAFKSLPSKVIFTNY